MLQTIKSTVNHLVPTVSARIKWDRLKCLEQFLMQKWLYTCSLFSSGVWRKQAWVGCKAVQHRMTPETNKQTKELMKQLSKRTVEVWRRSRGLQGVCWRVCDFLCQTHHFSLNILTYKLGLIFSDGITGNLSLTGCKVKHPQGLSSYRKPSKYWFPSPLLKRKKSWCKSEYLRPPFNVLLFWIPHVFPD